MVPACCSMPHASSSRIARPFCVSDCLARALSFRVLSSSGSEEEEEKEEGGWRWERATRLPVTGSTEVGGREG